MLASFVVAGWVIILLLIMTYREGGISCSNLGRITDDNLSLRRRQS